MSSNWPRFNSHKKISFLFQSYKSTNFELASINSYAVSKDVLLRMIL